MFNLGSDDKKELEENMNEIKNMIQGQKSGDDGEDTQNLDSGGQNMPDQSLNTGPEDGQDQLQGSADIEDSDFPDSGSQELEDLGDGSQGQQQAGPGMEQDPGLDQQQGNQGTQDPLQNRNENRGQQPDTPDLDVDRSGNQKPEQNQVINQDDDAESQGEPEPREKGDIDELDTGSDGPMFLKEEDFLDMREKLEEMGYLTQQMKQNLDKIKSTIKKERDTTKDALDLVDSFRERRTDVESTIKSGQK